MLCQNLQGLLRMVVGDHVRIIASPDLCYGSKGFYPLIPANSALIIQVGRGGQHYAGRVYLLPVCRTSSTLNQISALSQRRTQTNGRILQPACARKDEGCRRPREIACVDES